jgi:sugar (pentulose or hexulose) kinase
MSSAAAKVAKFIGVDVATSKTGIGVRGVDGQEQYADHATEGATTWHGQPAFDLGRVAGTIASVLRRLEQDGWDFRSSPGALSLSVRQHDMVVLDAQDRPLLPALSWQCHVAGDEVATLRKQGAEAVVGRVEERFILPKLMWTLRQDGELKNKIARVLTTGDWIAQQLTGESRLSASDALSNGLLVQATKQLADEVINNAGLKSNWFPQVIPSAHVVGTVTQRDGATSDWAELQSLLAGWSVVAGLGDNHATGVGCGGLVDLQTIVVSAGTSGTINRRCRPTAKLAGHAACFEFYDDRMLLMMLADCCKWYDRFRERFAANTSYPALNELATSVPATKIARVANRNGEEFYPGNWNDLSEAERAAGTQFSIMLELLVLVKTMLAEVTDATEPVRRFVLTGGLSQSLFFQEVFHAGVRLLVPGSDVLVSARNDKLSNQTAAYGAVINAMLPQRGHNLKAIVEGLCPLKPCTQASGDVFAQLQSLLRTHLLV